MLHVATTLVQRLNALLSCDALDVNAAAVIAAEAVLPAGLCGLAAVPTDSAASSVALSGAAAASSGVAATRYSSLDLRLVLAAIGCVRHAGLEY
jgi:hypothetical protein